MTLTAAQVKKELAALSDPAKAVLFPKFFKTAPGQYGAGDRFIGVTVPKQRQAARRFLNLPLPELQRLLNSPVHEYRFTALEILVAKYEMTEVEPLRAQLYRFYLRNRKFVNNWDLVDTSAPYVAGHFLYHYRRTAAKNILNGLAHSKSIWDRRIAIVSTHYFIRQKNLELPLAIAQILMHDRHDLIHKALGWTLREVGKVSKSAELRFLSSNSKIMPRTALRYAIERFSTAERRRFLKTPRNLL